MNVGNIESRCIVAMPPCIDVAMVSSQRNDNVVNVQMYWTIALRRQLVIMSFV